MYLYKKGEVTHVFWYYTKNCVGITNKKKIGPVDHRSHDKNDRSFMDEGGRIRRLLQPTHSPLELYIKETGVKQ